MNRVSIVIILVLAVAGIWACDTPSNITPINESFFVKLYAGEAEGDQFGNDIIATSDGGLLIVGTSRSRTSNASEILLIKTDDRGNMIWTSGVSSKFGITSNSEAKSVLELTDGYLVGGTIVDGPINKSVLIKTDFDGEFLDLALISTLDTSLEYDNNLSKITHVSDTTILVTGQTLLPASDGGGINGFVSLFNVATFLPEEVGDTTIWIFGLPGNDYVVGGYAVNTIGSDSTKYLIFGSSDGGDVNSDSKFYYQGYTAEFVHSKGIDATRLNKPGIQTAAYVTRFNETFWVIGDTNENQMFLIGWKFSSSPEGNWVLDDASSGNVLTNDADVVGKGVTVQSANNYVIVGDGDDLTDDISNTEIYLVRADENLGIASPPWPKTYGTSTSLYSANAVTTLPDGSIIILGTADLQDIKKIIVIKTGPNGEMSF